MDAYSREEKYLEPKLGRAEADTGGERRMIDGRERIQWRTVEQNTTLKVFEFIGDIYFNRAMSDA